MARKPNFQFERMERDRQKAAKLAEKAAAKREARERDRAANNPDGPSDQPASTDDDS